ncbi:hypothetical protein HBI40_120670 [Parastagonospora nodorum]|nr:hypothetical protein HBI41_132120 [Parastagonospora nodorum]KAH6285973.1 hypothetical protein HBI40_120670 [Parastagonospora nodorum]
MLLSHFKRLCITSATLIAASPLATVVPKSTSLPSVLQQAVPSCAQTCVQASLAEKFPVACSGQENIQCLCSRYSNNGESLGEVALGCVYTGCSMVDQGAASAYNVCLGQQDAVMPTKSVLTVVASSAPRTTSTILSKSIAVPTPTTTLRTTGTSTRSIVIDSISSTPSATSSSTSTFVAVPAAVDPPPKMTPAQIAGLSVAAVAAFVIAVGLMALSVCLRRKRERKNAFDSDEKGSSTNSSQLTSRFSNFVAAGSTKVPSSRFTMAIPPAARKGGKHVKLNANRVRDHEATLRPTRPVQRNGVGTANSASDSSLPLSQIGVAISAELDGTSAVPQITTQAPSQLERGRPKQSQLSVPFRPVSTMTQDTVFEEDETTARRRSSALLPTPPVPVAPIRSLQPSKRAATFDTAVGSSGTSKNAHHKSTRRSELFLEIPVRHERPQPRRIIAAQMPSTGSPQQLPGRPNWAAPPSQMKASASPQKTPGSSDIDDYYFSTHQNTKPLPVPGYAVRARDSPKSVNLRTKRSGSTVSRTASRASTNFRDSGSSQTSFETADPSDPTPDDDDDDKQLSDDAKLSPVAESPISKLRYPKVPRASNQLVPRSPCSPQHVHSFNTSRTHLAPRRNQPSPPSTSHLLHNRHKDLAPLLLETRVPLKLNAPKDVAMLPRPPLKDPFTSPPRARTRTHVRSNSTESWSTTPRSKIDRKSRTQSVASPNMYEEPVVIRPLNVRRKRDEMREINVGRDVDHDAEGLRSPVWIPKLTPTKKGDDLFISVGWGGR